MVHFESEPDKPRRSVYLSIAEEITDAAAPQLPAEVRRELTRAVGRMKDTEAKRELHSTLGRFFVYERPSEGSLHATTGHQPAAYDLFISCSTKDIDLARDLARELQSRGMHIFLSADVIDAAVGSASWIAAIDEALVTSRALIVLITQHSLDSKWVAEEWGKCYQHIVETGARRMFSVRLGGPSASRLPLTLRRFQIIESATGRIEPEHLTRIMDIVRGS